MSGMLLNCIEFLGRGIRLLFRILCGIIVGGILAGVLGGVICTISVVGFGMSGADTGVILIVATCAGAGLGGSVIAVYSSKQQRRDSAEGSSGQPGLVAARTIVADKSL